MQESDGLAFGTEARLFVDEANSCGAAPIERRSEVIDCKTHVVDPWSTFGDEFADG